MWILVSASTTRVFVAFSMVNFVLPFCRGVNAGHQFAFLLLEAKIALAHHNIGEVHCSRHLGSA